MNDANPIRRQGIRASKPACPIKCCTSGAAVTNSHLQVAQHAMQGRAASHAYNYEGTT